MFPGCLKAVRISTHLGRRYHLTCVNRWSDCEGDRIEIVYSFIHHNSGSGKVSVLVGSEVAQGVRSLGGVRSPESSGASRWGGQEPRTSGALRVQGPRGSGASVFYVKDHLYYW